MAYELWKTGSFEGKCLWEFYTSNVNEITFTIKFWT